MVFAYLLVSELIHMKGVSNEKQIVEEPNVRLKGV